VETTRQLLNNLSDGLSGVQQSIEDKNTMQNTIDDINNSSQSDDTTPEIREKDDDR